jgi:sugar phosphate isomerase/epimerase
MIFDRRTMLAGVGSAAMASLAAPAAARGKSRLGIVEITLTKQLAQDYAGTLRRLPAMGYTHFGFRMTPGGNGQPGSREKARMVRDAGLEVGVARFGQAGDRDIEDAVAIGAKVIALSAAPPFFASGRLGVTTRAAFDAYLPQLAALAAKCRAAGLTFAYHNHWWDLLPLEGRETPLDLIERAVPPADLAFEADLGWCWLAGVAPLDLLHRLGPRVVSMHLKDVDRRRARPAAANAGLAEQSLATTSQMTVIGQGEMGYAALLPRIRKLTSAVGYIEVDLPDDGLVAAAQGARFFRDNR